MECCGVYGMLEVVIVSDVYPSLACRIPSHVALRNSEPLPGAIGSCHFHHCNSTKFTIKFFIN